LCFARNAERIKALVGEVIKRTGLPSLTKSSMQESVLKFPAGAVAFDLADGIYQPSRRDSYELLDTVRVENSVNRESFRLRGKMIWGQKYLVDELKSGTKIRIKTDGFVPYVDKSEDGALRPAKLIPSERVGDVLAANAEIRALFDEDVFTYPKPTSLIDYLLGFRPEHGVVLDFYAGSGTTGHAVAARSAADKVKRRYILVQLPEPLDPQNADHSAGIRMCDSLKRPRNIAELTKERLRRASKMIAEAQSLNQADTGFRVFRLDLSSFAEWSGFGADGVAAIERSVNNLRPDRTDDDLLCELLLRRGLDLCVPIETKVIAGKKVHSIGAGSLIACLDKQITRADAEPLALGIVAWHKAINPAGETAVIFRDDAFADDVVKTNVAAILDQHGLKNVRSL